jgi:hypothetical protein
MTNLSVFLILEWTLCSKLLSKLFVFSSIKVLKLKKILKLHVLAQEKNWVFMFNGIALIFTIGDGTFGEYKWKSYQTMKTLCRNLIRGIKYLNGYSMIEYQNKLHKFLGFYSKMREELVAFDIAAWHDSVTTVKLHKNLKT